MNQHILQSEEWEKVEKMEGREIFSVKLDGFLARGVVMDTPMGKYLWTKYGPEANDFSSFKKGMKRVEQIANEYNATFVRVEPRNPSFKKKMADAGYVKTKDIEPEWTLVLKLAGKSEEEILAGMESRKVRYWRNYIKKGMQIRKSKDPNETKILVDLLQKLGEKDHFNAYSLEHLQNEVKAGFATLYFVDYKEDDKPAVCVAAALVYDYKGTRYYMHAATNEKYRKLMSGTILLIQMIVDAYRDGAKQYDFWGITKSEDPNHPWYGFTQYKKSFGGEEVEYAGTWDLVLRPAKYRLYKGLRKVNRYLRRK